jgi:hypothetical protein
MAIAGLALIISSTAGAVVWKPDSGKWKKMPALPEAISGHRAVVTGDSILVLGGRNRFNKTVPTVLRARLGRDGGFKSWIRDADLPFALAGHTAGVVDGSVFICGGMRGNGTGEVISDRVWTGKPAVDGSIAQWVAGESLPEPVYGHAAASCLSRIYVIGGMTADGTRQAVLAGTVSGGRVVSWAPVLSLPTPMSNAAAVVVDRYLLVIGGQSPGEGKSLVLPTVYVGSIWDDGSITTWYLASSKLPGAWLGFGRSQTSAMAYRGTILCFGGQDALWFLLNSIAIAGFDVKRGEIGSWGVAQDEAASLPQVTSAALWKDCVYLVGGISGGAVSAGVIRGTLREGEEE